MARNLAHVKTPVTPAGLRKYDQLTAADAARRAWSQPGSNPGWDADVRETIRALHPLLARALDRMMDGPLIITTQAELDALPARTVIRECDDKGEPWYNGAGELDVDGMGGRSWWWVGAEMDHDPDLPVEVLWMGDGVSEPGPPD
jgi:hypothetical protein